MHHCFRVLGHCMIFNAMLESNQAMLAANMDHAA